MRLFVAVGVSDAIRLSAETVIAELRRRVSQLDPDARVTWVGADRLHLTLRFIGEVDRPRLSDLRTALSVPIRQAPFEIAVRGLGAFPARGSPRVIWAGVGAGRHQLIALAQTVASRLETAGIKSDMRPFHPHLTLGRVRQSARLRRAPLLVGLEDVAIGTGAVAACTLFESRAGPDRARYSILTEAPLVPTKLSTHIGV
jgi:RNA 2',3'-cyclic 3'-phosphodiesterase